MVSLDFIRLAAYNVDKSIMAIFTKLRRGIEMEYMTIQEAAERWGISERRIQVLCSGGRLKGAVKFGRQWAIPDNTKKPDDARIKSGKYIKHQEDNLQ